LNEKLVDEISYINGKLEEKLKYLTDDSRKLD